LGFLFLEACVALLRFQEEISILVNRRITNREGFKIWTDKYGDRPMRFVVCFFLFLRWYIKLTTSVLQHKRIFNKNVNQSLSTPEMQVEEMDVSFKNMNIATHIVESARRRDTIMGGPPPKSSVPTKAKTSSISSSSSIATPHKKTLTNSTSPSPNTTTTDDKGKGSTPTHSRNSSANSPSSSNSNAQNIQPLTSDFKVFFVPPPPARRNTVPNSSSVSSSSSRPSTRATSVTAK
jgi:hypothetical protein